MKDIAVMPGLAPENSSLFVKPKGIYLTGSRGQGTGNEVEEVPMVGAVEGVFLYTFLDVRITHLIHVGTFMNVLQFRM